MEQTRVSRRSFLKAMGAALAWPAWQPLGAGASAKQARPNILFCIADDASYPHMGAYGCSWVKTPGFDRVAREGVLFTHAYTPNAKCAPSRSCILTGRNSWQLEAAANHWCYFPAKFKTYAEALAEHGYFVGFTGKGWGPGRARRDRRQAAAVDGPAVSNPQGEAARDRGSRNRLRRQLRRLPRRPARGHAVLLLVRRLRAAPRLRVRFGPQEGRQADSTRSTASRASGPTTKPSAPTCSTTPSRSSTSTGTVRGCWRSWRSAACWTTRWSSSRPTTACRSRASRARRTNTRTTCRWR